MRQFVESLRRLYQAARITQDKVKELLDGGKITQYEYDYIVAAE